MKQLFSNILIFLTLGLVLGLSIRGQSGNPTESSFRNESYKNEGPLELSPERGRFILTYSLLEDNSFSFTVPLAQFATPDVGYQDGKYVSLFAPGVSLLVMPGYLLGKAVGVSQVGTYAVVSLFAIANFFLIRALIKRLGIPSSFGTMGASIFLFATPAFSYAVSLYQHHISVFLLLSALYLLLHARSMLSHLLFWIVVGTSIIVDYPNAFMMLPLVLYEISQIIQMKYNMHEKVTQVRVVLPKLFAGVSVLLPLGFFLWINLLSYGSPTQLAGAVPSVDEINAQGNPVTLGEINGEKVNLFDNLDIVGNPDAVSFFDTRNILNGFYIHFISPDRGIVFFTPIIIVGLLGGILIYRKISHSILIFSIIGVNILLYSMWGDPWGGWAFGSRYLIPTYALTSIILGVLLYQFWSSVWFKTACTILFVYAVAVNTLGALTTNRVPPQVQVLELESISGKEEKYTYERNIDYLREKGSKAFIYQAVMDQFLPATAYYLLVLMLIYAFTGTVLLATDRTQSTREGGTL